MKVSFIHEVNGNRYAHGHFSKVAVPRIGEYVRIRLGSLKSGHSTSGWRVADVHWKFSDEIGNQDAEVVVYLSPSDEFPENEIEIRAAEEKKKPLTDEQQAAEDGVKSANETFSKFLENAD